MPHERVGYLTVIESRIESLASEIGCAETHQQLLEMILQRRMMVVQIHLPDLHHNNLNGFVVRLG